MAETIDETQIVDKIVNALTPDVVKKSYHGISDGLERGINGMPYEGVLITLNQLAGSPVSNDQIAEALGTFSYDGVKKVEALAVRLVRRDCGYLLSGSIRAIHDNT